MACTPRTRPRRIRQETDERPFSVLEEEQNVAASESVEQQTYDKQPKSNGWRSGHTRNRSKKFVMLPVKLSGPA